MKQKIKNNKKTLQYVNATFRGRELRELNYSYKYTDEMANRTKPRCHGCMPLSKRGRKKAKKAKAIELVLTDPSIDHSYERKVALVLEQVHAEHLISYSWSVTAKADDKEDAKEDTDAKEEHYTMADIKAGNQEKKGGQQQQIQSLHAITTQLQEAATRQVSGKKLLLSKKH